MCVKVDVLINQLDEHNQGNILATKKFSPKEVIFIRGNKDDGAIKAMKEYYTNYFPNINFKEVLVEEGEIKQIQKLINEYKNKNILVNLTGGKRINTLLMLNICKESCINTIYIDIINKKLYHLTKDIEAIREEFEDLEIEDIVKAAGGEIISEATKLCDKKDLVYLTKCIYRNIKVWHKYKQKLYDGNIFIHDYKDPKNVVIETTLLKEEEEELLRFILEELKNINGIEYKNINKSQIKVLFLNEYLKSFIFKSGTWLEIATRILIKDIKEVDQVKSGLMFLWNNDVKAIRNELDVVAIKDSVPIIISCKDSNKYNELALNELNVYSEKIGGEKIYKILVATKEPLKISVKERAKEMGINIVIFDGNEEQFRKNIINIIT